MSVGRHHGTAPWKPVAAVVVLRITTDKWVCANLPCPSARSRLKAALIRAKWVNACGKLPRASPLLPVCSAYKPRWLA